MANAEPARCPPSSTYWPLSQSVATVIRREGQGLAPAMAHRPPDEPTSRARALDRRGFLGVAGGAALLCGIGAHPIAQRAVAEVAQADAAARPLRKPASAREPIDTTTFPTPQPQPGGQQRVYWLAGPPGTRENR